MKRIKFFYNLFSFFKWDTIFAFCLKMLSFQLQEHYPLFNSLCYLANLVSLSSRDNNARSAHYGLICTFKKSLCFVHIYLLKKRAGAWPAPVW